MTTRMKYGWHFGPGGNATGSGSFLTELDRAGIPTVYKSVDSMTGLYDMQVIMRESTVPHVPIYRSSTYGQGDGYSYDVPPYHLQPHTAAQLHWDKTKASLPPELDPELTWIEPINEVDKNRSEWLGEFSSEIAALAMADGYKVLLFGWSSGEPDPHHWEGPHMLDFLRLCALHPDKVGIAVHEYDYHMAGPSDPTVTPYHYGRYEVIHDVCDKHGIGRPTIAVTEWGWTYVDVPPQFVDWCEEAGKIYARHSNVLGCAIWYLGPGFGGIADKVNPYMQPLLERIKSVVYDIDPEEPEVKHKAIVVKAPQDMTAEEWQLIAQESFDFRHTLTASHDDMMTILQGGNPLSYVKFAYPDRDADSIALVESAGYRWEPLFGEPSPPIDEGLYLSVEPLSQRDPRWAADVIGMPTGHGKTIGNWGCLLVAYNMQARYWGLTERLPGVENLHYVANGCFNGPYMAAGALQRAYPGHVTYDGYKMRTDPTMRQKIRDWIDNGWPVACEVDFDPADSDFDQHWVLVIGYAGDTDFWMADPWEGDIEIVNNRYPIAGSDILQAIFYHPIEVQPPTDNTIDLVEYMFPQEGRIYEVRHPGGSQERIQHQVEGTTQFITKGENQGFFERWEYDSKYIYLVRDTSPGPDSVFYDVAKPDGSRTPWCLRHMAVGQSFNDGGHVVTFKSKETCSPIGDPRSGNSANSSQLLAHYDAYAFSTGILLNDVIAIRGNTETHYFAKGYGRVQWSSPWGQSTISEIHAPGARPDIDREVLPC